MERPLTQHIHEEPLDLRGYERVGGYQALRKALQTMAPEEVTREVGVAGLRGRGGAGFVTAMKWRFVPMGERAPRPKFLLANADEMEPGTFKDRLLLEGNPHQLLEGMIVAAYAIQADVATIFLRWAYRLAAQRLTRALAEAYQAGYLGKNILGTGYSLEMGLHISAGRYMCGEETGLINALEGKRANPRSKPPFPPISGLFGRPSVVNNVETLCCVPHIIDKGASWFMDLGRGSATGTKIYGASGRVKRPGCYELPLGTTAREILEEHAGGMRAGYGFRGLLPGGASTDFLTEEYLDTPMDFDSVQAAGSRMGTGTMIVLDDGTCPVGMVLNMERFFARESCGWCTPCREGLPWVTRILSALEEGRGRLDDLEVLAMHAKMLNHAFCALAPGAAEPLGSALRHFRGDFERHITEGRCPWRG